MNHSAVSVLYENNHLLVINKPCGMPTMSATDGSLTAYQWSVDYLRQRYDKPGKVFLGVVSRLDRVTSGVLLFARTSKAASRMTIQFGGAGKNKNVPGKAKKLYLALVQGKAAEALPDSGELVDQVYKDESSQRMRVLRQHDRGGQSTVGKLQEARLQYQVLTRRENHCLLAVRLLTGRKHQIRLQFSHRGLPIMADQKYGSEAEFARGGHAIALHSWQLKCFHPTTQESMHFCADVPQSWQKLIRHVPETAKINAQLSETLNW